MKKEIPEEKVASIWLGRDIGIPSKDTNYLVDIDKVIRLANIRRNVIYRNDFVVISWVEDSYEYNLVIKDKKKATPYLEKHMEALW